MKAMHIDLVCGLCSPSRQPGIVGTIIRLRGHRVVHVYDYPSARRLANWKPSDGTDPIGEMVANGFADPSLLDDPSLLGDPPPRARHFWVNLDVGRPEVINVWCRHHGQQTVRSLDLVAIAASRPQAARMPIKFISGHAPSAT